MNAAGTSPEQKRRARPSIAACNGAISLGVGGFAAALVALRVLGYGEIWGARAQTLVIISGISASLAALACLAALHRWRGLGRRAVSFSIAALFTAVYLAAFCVSYVIENRLISGQFEPNPDRPLLSFLFSSLQTVGMFGISSPRYFFPWVLPVLIGTVALALPRLHRALEATRDAGSTIQG